MRPDSPPDVAAVERTCIRLFLHANQGTYCAPSKGYDEQHTLSSTLAPLGWMYIDPRQAVIELESLFDQQSSTGMIPCTKGSDGAAVPLIASVFRLLFHFLRKSNGDLASRLVRLLPHLDRFHLAWHHRSLGNLCLAGPTDGRIMEQSPTSPAPRWDVGMNAILVQADTDLADVAIQSGIPTAEILARRCHRAEALTRQLWCNEHQIFLSRDPEPSLSVVDPPLSTEGLLPLWSGSALRLQAQAMIERHLQQESVMWGKHPLAVTSPAGEPRVVPLFNWLMIRGLHRYGYTAQAEQLRLSLLNLVARYGPWETFSTSSGAGQGAEDSIITAAIALDLHRTPVNFKRW